MASQSRAEEQSAWVILLTSVMVGALVVIASVFAFGLLVGPGATREAELSRVTSFMYWTQPFIYVMAGLLAGSRDSRWGPVRAPIIGLLLASICWVMLRKQELLPSEGNVVAYLMTAGALFTLGGAMIAPLIRDYVGKAVGGLVLLGVVAFAWTYLNLGSISGVVQREHIVRIAGQAAKWETVAVPGAAVSLLDADGTTVLYSTTTNNGGRYQISGAPVGDYALRVKDPTTPAVLTEQVTLERSLTGGTRWKLVALPTITEDTGNLFE